MSDNRRRARELQRAKQAERAARGPVVRVLRELSEFSVAYSDAVGRDDGMHDALDIDAFDELVARARYLAAEHVAAYARLAELEGPVKP